MEQHEDPLPLQMTTSLIQMMKTARTVQLEVVVVEEEEEERQHVVDYAAENVLEDGFWNDPRVDVPHHQNFPQRQKTPTNYRFQLDMEEQGQLRQQGDGVESDVSNFP